MVRNDRHVKNVLMEKVCQKTKIINIKKGDKMKKVYDKVNLLTKNEIEQNTRINNLSFDLLTELISYPGINVENVLTTEFVLDLLFHMRSFIKMVMNHKIPSLNPSENDFIKWFETFINVSIQTGFMTVNNN